MWREYNNNPKGHRVGDCAVRAVSVALGVDWDTAYAMLAAEGFERKDMPSSDAVWGSLLLNNGFVREACPDCIVQKTNCCPQAQFGCGAA